MWHSQKNLGHLGSHDVTCPSVTSRAQSQWYDRSSPRRISGRSAAAHPVGSRRCSSDDLSLITGLFSRSNHLRMGYMWKTSRNHLNLTANTVIQHDQLKSSTQNMGIWKQKRNRNLRKRHLKYKQFHHLFGYLPNTYPRNYPRKPSSFAVTSDLWSARSSRPRGLWYGPGEWRLKWWAFDEIQVPTIAKCRYASNQTSVLSFACAQKCKKAIFNAHVCF